MKKNTRPLRDIVRDPVFQVKDVAEFGQKRKATLYLGDGHRDSGDGLEIVMVIGLEPSH
jgi:hypothetical protein